MKSRVKKMGRKAVVKGMALAAMLLAGGVASATSTNTFYVAKGEAISLDAICAASNVTAFATEDWIIKTGPGTLTGSKTLLKNCAVNIDIREGVYSLPDELGEKNQYGGRVYVRNGATFNIGGGKILATGWTYVEFEGSGTGEGDNLGAIAVGGSMTNPSFGAASTFVMRGDATIYSYGSMNAIFSANGSDIKYPVVLNMLGHTLTLLNKSAGTVFRPRWAWMIKNSGPIVVNNGVFARHKTTTQFTPYIPNVAFTNGAVMATYGDKSLWNQVDSFTFEKGTKIAKKSDGETGAKMTLAKVAGPVEITSDATVTISTSLVLRSADLAAGYHLTSKNLLTFGASCTLTLADLPASPTPGASYTIAQSEGGFSGLPKLAGAAAAYYTLNQEGNALIVTVKENVLVLQTGEENAEANSAAIARYAATLADGDFVCFPDGEYFFARPLDFSAVTAKGLSFGSPAGKAVLNGALLLGAASDVTVSGLTFKGCEGPAVVATNTVGLTVTGCTLDHVIGAWANGTNYPFAAVNVADLDIIDNTLLFDACRWGGQAYLEGGSQVAESEAREGEVVFRTLQGILTADWWAWGQMTNRVGLAAEAYPGRVLRKTGLASLDISDAANDPLSNGVERVIIEEGQIVSRTEGALGKVNSEVCVTNRGTLTLYKQSPAIFNRRVRFSGTGVDGWELPAIRFTGWTAWNKTSGVHWFLEGDAAMYNNCSGECGTFLWTTVTMNGHTLTLQGISGCNFRFGRTANWYGGGTVVVKSPVTVSASKTTDNDGPSSFFVKEGPAPLFKFQKGTSLVLDNGDFLQLASRIDFAVGSTLALKKGFSDYNLVFADLTGVPTVAETIASIGVTNALTARVSELQAGNILTLTGANQKLVLGAAGAPIPLLLDGTLPEKPEMLTVAEAAGGIVGPRPTLSDALRAAGWRTRYTAGRTRLLLAPQTGEVLFVR